MKCLFLYLLFVVVHGMTETEPMLAHAVMSPPGVLPMLASAGQPVPQPSITPGSPLLSEEPTTAPPSNASGCISGTVKEDIGIPISGVLIHLILVDGVEFHLTTSTGSDGGYIFCDLATGEYAVVQINLYGCADAPNPEQRDNYLLFVSLPLASSSSSTNNDFVDVNLHLDPQCISGTVQKDIDGDTIGDVPLEGVGIDLHMNHRGYILTTSHTDSSGKYEFCHLQPEVYILVKYSLVGYMGVSDTDGPNDNTITVTLTPSATNSKDNDFVDAVAAPQASRP